MSGQPRLLIVSNECLSNMTSNGRTLQNFLIGWPKDRIAQFCIRKEFPDNSVCSNYYYVSDRAAMKAFLRRKPATPQEPGKQTMVQNCRNPGKTKRRNAVTMLLRNVVWNSMCWAGSGFHEWIDRFSPEVILLQAGDCAFMLRLARKLAEKRQIPLIIYNSEGYYFKKYDYFRSSGLAKLAYPLFYRQFCSEFDKTVQMARKSIYSCEKLKIDYDAVFGLPSEVVYTATQMVAADKQYNEPLCISYLGNLGVGRHESLIAIGNALQSISPELKLDVYGKVPSADVEKAFLNCAGIRLKGIVSYEEVLRVMHESDLLVHAENFAGFYREDLKYAFSTKIADSLASGTCFLLYAPGTMACCEYLRENDAAWVVTEQSELAPVLEKLCKNPQERLRYLSNARRLAEKNHNWELCGGRFRQILCVQNGDEQ